LIEGYRAAPLHCVQTTAGLLNARIHGVATQRIEIRDVSLGGGMVLTADSPFPRFAVAIGLAGQIGFFSKRLTDSNMGYLTGQNGMIARLQPGSRWCNMSLEWDLIRQVAETHGYVIPDGDHSCGMPLSNHKAIGHLLSRTARGLQNADVSNAELEDVMARAVLRILNAGSGSIRVRRADRWRAVHRVIDFILAEYADPITVTNLCRIAGIGERSLEYLFRSATGFTMQQYLMNHRLHRARTMLLHGEYETVKDVAEACGIPHAGRFAQYFKRQYGQLPREMLAAR